MPIKCLHTYIVHILLNNINKCMHKFDIPIVINT